MPPSPVVTRCRRLLLSLALAFPSLHCSPDERHIFAHTANVERLLCNLMFLLVLHHTHMVHSSIRVPTFGVPGPFTRMPYLVGPRLLEQRRGRPMANQRPRAP
ncbi:hypothetical protein DE146DRAFT_134665 [Phaeosphaeria sp. MPI-PUGE-AT-0046c]|nr:hypothetical protein DE146DRAFT_134665 [Phaeosphaeria sp. MPI-PUGE-AT-0046c]